MSDKPDLNLPLLENIIAAKRLQGRPLPAEVARRHVVAARDFARAVTSGPGPAYVRAFQEAYNIAINSQVRDDPANAAPAAEFSLLNKGLAASSSGIPSDPVFLKNAIEIIGDSDRILGGSETTEFPECVAVGAADRWCCTGTLIAKNAVLTAGHCYGGGCVSRVFFGTDVQKPGNVLNVAHAIQHPQYKQNGRHNDLAVLVLPGDVTTVAPRPIIRTADLQTAHFVRLAGYGTTDITGTIGYGLRRCVDVPLASSNPDRYGSDPGLEFVAGAPFLNKDTCSGDSGGPAYLQVGANWLLAGATSRGVQSDDPTRRCGDGGIYVSLDQYAAWLHSLNGLHW